MGIAVRTKNAVKKSPLVELQGELVGFFRRNRERLRKAWIEQMTGKGYLAALTMEETESESKAIYDMVIDTLETGDYAAAGAYANTLAERGVLRGMTTEQIISGLLVLRDVYGRNLFESYRHDREKLTSALDIYEPVANRILSIAALAFLEEREKVVRDQQEAIRELSTPVLQIRDKLLILPIIGLIDSTRARQLTEQLLNAIRDKRAKVVVIDITGVPVVDSKVASHLIQTADAVAVMGGTAIFTGVSPGIAQTVVTLGIDLTKLKTVGDLEGGIEEADRMLGFKVQPTF